MGSANLAAEAAKRRSEAIAWLNDLLPDFNLLPDASEEELRERLVDGSVFYGILRRTSPGYLAESRGGDYLLPRSRLECLSSFLLVLDELGLPSFKVVDLEQGPMTSVVTCLLSLREHLSNGDGRFPKSLPKCRSQPVNRSTTLEVDKLDTKDVSRAENTQGLQKSISLVEERKKNLRELRTTVIRSPLSSGGLLEHGKAPEKN